MFTMNALAIAGAAELLVSLTLAWLGAFTMYLRPPLLTRLFPRPMYIIKTHIDFLLMALLLFAFYLLAVPLPGWIIACTIIGSVSNPFLFIVLAVNQQPDMSPTGLLGIGTVLSFLIATAGFGGAGLVLLLHFLGS